MSGVIFGMDFMLNGQAPVDAGRVMSSPEHSDDVAFDDLLDQFIEETADLETRDQRVEALRSTIDELDESEVVGFLAMLENQAGWQMDQQPLAEVVDLQSRRDPVQWRDPVQGSARPVLSDALGKALEKAMENYLPGEDDEQAVPDVLMNKNGASQLANSQMSADINTASPISEARIVVEEPVGYQPAVELTVQQASPELMLSKLFNGAQDAFLQNPVASVVHGSAPVITNYQGAPVLSNHHTASVESAYNQQPVVVQSLIQMDSGIDLRQANWSETMGQRLVAMVGESRQEAYIRLDPPELGAIGVRLIVEDAGVSVQFASAVPQVREMLEAQAERLRYGLESQGLDLIDVNVGDDGGGQSAQQDGSDQSGFAGNNKGEPMELVELAVVDVSPDLPRGFVSTFA